MCGIFAVCHYSKSGHKLPRYSQKQIQTLSWRQKHRGPDFCGFYQNTRTGDVLSHRRLSIIDLTCTHPIRGTTEDHQVIHNGEIYNHEDLRKTVLKGYDFKTSCDSEVIIFLYEMERSGMMCNTLHGVFTFVLIYEDEFLVARDPIGVKPLYYGVDAEGRHLFSSEMKAIEDLCGEYEMGAFPPGHYWTPESGFIRYYNPPWFNHLMATNDGDMEMLRSQLISATTKRLMSDAPLGILLSGGVDSSLIGSIANRGMRQRGIQLHSFSIGLNSESPDLVAARKVAEFFGAIHHEFHFTVQEGIGALEKVIWHLETYDVTSIRASTPMLLMAKKISDLGVKVVLSGEGADEIFGGYLYFRNAPTDDEFQKETIRRVKLLSTADCLRADKSCMAHGLEVRVPFLDKTFLDFAMRMRPAEKRAHLHDGRKFEKWILRTAFDTPDDPYIPDEILWRQKEQFSDGVGYAWIDGVTEYCEKQVSDYEMSHASEIFPIDTPHSKEAFYMRKVFHKHFPSDNAVKTVEKWIPKWQDNPDPSGRASKFHIKTYNSVNQLTNLMN